MNVGVIITIYKNLEALRVVIDAIRGQSMLPYEIIIAEDNNSGLIKEFIKGISIKDVKIKHTFQEDNGWQRNKSTNNALRVAESDYLIFIDGDCVPHSRFIESHVALAKENTLLCGRRVYLGENSSKLLQNESISPKEFEDSYIKNAINITKNARHYEEGLYFNPSGIAYRTLKLILRKKTWLIGCNWSVWQNDLMSINGFDEDFNMPLYGEDIDVERRLRGIGIKVESCRNASIVYHLNHEKVFGNNDYIEPYELMKSKDNQFVCKNGVNKL